MTIDKILVNFFGVIAILFVYWFFLMKKDKQVIVHGSVDIVVDGGYTPSIISIPSGQSTKINFFRKDPSSCLEEVVLSDFKIRKFLPLNQKVTIEVKPEKPGEYPFACGMNMFHGKIIVKD